VRPSFNEVNQAEQERERLINEAQSQYNQVVPRAQGEAQQTIEQAEGYALDRVNRAQGDAARFDALYGEYRKAPDVTRTRLYLETLGQVLPTVGKKVVVDEDLRGVLPLLNLDRTSSPPPPGATP
jgi:membrane protease subunit HflK